MPIHPKYAVQIIREGMDDYWRVIFAPSDEGLSQIEIGWRRDHEASAQRFNEKYASELDILFGKR